MDSIVIDQLEVQTIIGTLPHERLQRQPLIITAELRSNLKLAGETDDFNCTFDYSRAEEMIYDFVSRSDFHLIEALAEQLAARLLTIDRIESVLLEIRKPGAAKYARSIGVRIERSRT